MDACARQGKIDIEQVELGLTYRFKEPSRHMETKVHMQSYPADRVQL
jgi:hypothetical protein